MASNQHYAKVMQSITEKKDSIFEPCKILDYNPETQLARVFFINSKQYRNEVPVLFPSMYLNSGIISPPVKESTGLAFWGSENNPFVMPAYFLPPMHYSENGAIKQTSSPSRVDSSLTLREIEGGEHLLRSLGGAYVFIKNLGEVEIGTSKLHKLALTEKDGALETIVERKRENIGGYLSYNGPVNPTSVDHHVKIEIDDTIPDWLRNIEDKDLLEEIFTGKSDLMNDYNYSPLFEMQAGNVYEGETKIQSDIDGTDLFMLASLWEKQRSDEQTKEERLKFDLSKKGALGLSLTNEGRKLKLAMTSQGLSVQLDDDGSNHIQVTSDSVSVNLVDGDRQTRFTISPGSVQMYVENETHYDQFSLTPTKEK